MLWRWHWLAVLEEWLHSGRWVILHTWSKSANCWSPNVSLLSFHPWGGWSEERKKKAQRQEWMRHNRIKNHSEARNKKAKLNKKSINSIKDILQFILHTLPARNRRATCSWILLTVLGCEWKRNMLGGQSLQTARNTCSRVRYSW
jgi:hypothetical protein